MIQRHNISVIDKSLGLEKSREEITSYFLSRSRKSNFHFSFYSRFSRFLEKNLIFSSQFVRFSNPFSFSSRFMIFFEQFSFSSRFSRCLRKILFHFSFFEIPKQDYLSLLEFSRFWERKISFSSRLMRFFKWFSFSSQFSRFLAVPRQLYRWPCH